MVLLVPLFVVALVRCCCACASLMKGYAAVDSSRRVGRISSHWQDGSVITWGKTRVTVIHPAVAANPSLWQQQDICKSGNFIGDFVLVAEREASAHDSVLEKLTLRTSARG